jgi:dephospho-CoA kinase
VTFVLGLTGSIGMGKSATAGIFRRLGVPVHDADATVHDLYRREGAVEIAKAFPGTVVDGVVDRAKLGHVVLNSPDQMKRLESIVHPLVRAREDAFLRSVASGGGPIAVLDIPLLFETGGQARCDAVTVVTTPPAIQRRRVLSRPGMTEEKWTVLLGRQMPDAEKRAKAHFVVDTSRGFASAEAQVRSILASLAGRPGRVLRS